MQNIIGWHRTKNPSAPEAIAYGGFDADKSIYGMYGKGVYLALNYDRHITHKRVNQYGPYMIEVDINPGKFIILDTELNKQFYQTSAPLDLPAQLARHGKPIATFPKLMQSRLIDANKQLKDIWRNGSTLNKYNKNKITTTSYIAGKIYEIIKKNFDGMNYTGRDDGPCMVMYNRKLLTPTKWTKINGSANVWQNFSSGEIKRIKINAASLPVRWMQHWQNVPLEQQTQKLLRCVQLLGPKRFSWFFAQLQAAYTKEPNQNTLSLLYKLQIDVPDAQLMQAILYHIFKDKPINFINFNANGLTISNLIFNSILLWEEQFKQLPLLKLRGDTLLLDYMIAIIEQLIQQLRQAWPQTQLTAKLENFIKEQNHVFRVAIKALYTLLNLQESESNKPKLLGKKILQNSKFEQLLSNYFNFIQEMLLAPTVQQNLAVKYLVYGGFGVSLIIGLDIKKVEIFINKTKKINDDDDDDDDNDNNWAKSKKKITPIRGAIKKSN